MEIVITDHTPAVEVTITENNVPVYVSVSDAQPVCVIEIKEGGGGGLTSVSWNDVNGKPQVFPPSEHTHDWDSISSKPTTFLPSIHTHSWNDILDKPNLFSGDYDSLSNKPDLTVFANKDAQNLDIQNVVDWQNKLGIKDVATPFQVGNIVTTSNSVTLNVHSSGINSVTIEGVVYSKTTADSWSYTPVTTNQKILIIYALPDSQIFYLAEGTEAVQAVEPSLPNDAIRISMILADTVGQTTGGGNNSNLFNQLSINSIPYKHQSGQLRNSGMFHYNQNIGLGIPNTPTERFHIGGYYRGDGFVPNGMTEAQRLAISPAKIGQLVYQTDGDAGWYECDATGGWGSTWVKIGSASFPETGSNGDVLEKDSAEDGGVKWSNRLTNAETAITTNTNKIADLEVYQIVINTSVSITTNTVGSVTGKSQHGRNVRISNGVNAINITCETSSNADFVASYTKLGSGAITFVAGSGATLVQVDGSAILNGAVGSTACLTRSGNTYYLQISNR